MRSEKKAMSGNRLLALVDKYRIFILFVIVFSVMTLFAPRFFNVFNLTSIMKVVAMNACVAIGFTIVMICGQLDLSIGTVITFAGVLGLSLKGPLGYAVSVPIAIAAGALVGLFNGLLVTKAKINSFIVTLGTMTILQGAIYTITGGNTISLSTPDAFAVSDFLAKPLLPLVTPRILITAALVLVFEIFLRKTQAGRNFYLVGGNKNTAWLAGIKTDSYLIAAFVLSGTMAAIGGVFFGMESSAATLKLGDQSLMYVISATIIGGTAMSGGKGGVFRTVVAILTLEMLYTGIILFGLGNEVKIFIAGLILATVVLYEAYAVYKHDKEVGKRPELVKELEAGNLPPGAARGSGSAAAGR
jgi:ribose transport system permease protein